jgi:hypothetical protein
VRVIDKNAAVSRARKVPSEMSAAAGEQFVLLEEEAREEPFGRVFFYQSAAFLASGDFSDSIREEYDRP